MEVVQKGPSRRGFWDAFNGKKNSDACTERQEEVQISVFHGSSFENRNFWVLIWWILKRFACFFRFCSWIVFKCLSIYSLKNFRSSLHVIHAMYALKKTWKCSQYVLKSIYHRRIFVLLEIEVGSSLQTT